MGKIFIDEVHAQNVLQRMWEQTESKEYCDVALIAGDTEEMQISAHRSVLSASSEYFKTMFTPPFNESTSKEVKLPNVDGETLKSLVKFCYSGRLEMSEDNAEKLFITADSLLLDAVVNACGSFLAEQLHPTNCLGMAQLAERHHCESFLKQAKDFCMRHFVELYKNDEFLNLSLEQLTELLASDDLRDPNEEHVFKSLIIWIEHDRSKRSQHIKELFKLVRLPLMKPSFLIEHVRPACTSFASLKLCMEAAAWHLMPECIIANAKPRRTDERLIAIQTVNNKLDILFHCPQRLTWLKWLQNLEYRIDFGVAVMEDDLFILGGSVGSTITNDVICLNLKTMVLKVVSPMIERRSNCGVAVVNGFLYAVGGLYGGNIISTVERYDSKSNTWTMVASMSVCRISFGITVFNGKFYIVGGCVNNNTFSSVECYLPQENLWAPIASMREQRLMPGLTVANGILYAVGGNGSRTIESYDHVTNNWTLICSFSEEISGRLCSTFNDRVILLHKDRVEEFNSTMKEWKVNTSIKGLKDTYYTFSFSGFLLESKFIEN